MTTEIPLLLTITDLALEKIKQFRDEEGLTQHRLRVVVLGGGCGGLRNNIDFDDKPLSDLDLEYELGGLQVVIDVFSNQHLEGTVLDYVNDSFQSGFKFNSSNTTARHCGCGQSWGYADE